MSRGASYTQGMEGETDRNDRDAVDQLNKELGEKARGRLCAEVQSHCGPMN